MTNPDDELETEPEKPSFLDTFWDGFFGVGGALKRAADTGAMDKDFYAEHEAYCRSIDEGLGLTFWCHLIDSRFGNRANFKAKLPSDEHRDIVDLLYYARNAFVHCAWDISKLDSENQKTKLRNFAGGGETCSFCSVFSMSLNGDRLKVKGVQNIGHILNKAVENAGSE